jgi:uncharacterized protein YndB with AHSA1/START domain
MPLPDFPPATFSHKAGVVEGRLGLLLDNHVEAVWSALTDPARLVEWLAPGGIELRQGGAVRLDFPDGGVIDSTVSAFEPKRLLEYSWSSPGEPVRPVRWELEPIGAAVRLIMTLRMPANEDAGRGLAGWAAHLEMLAAALAGVPVKFPFEVFKAAREAYRAQLTVASA